MSTKGLLTLFRRRRGNRTVHARQYDFSNQILITWIGHLDTCDELSQVLAHRQHRFCLTVERTKNDFVLGYRAVTLDRWYCGHGYFQNCPEGQKLAFFFGPDCGGILGLILKLFLVSVKQRPIYHPLSFMSYERAILLGGDKKVPSVACLYSKS
jgi:hypothetical protein